MNVNDDGDDSAVAFSLKSRSFYIGGEMLLQKKKKNPVNCLPYHITLAFKDNSFYCKIKSKIYELGYPII